MEGDVVVRVSHSTINYKDGLAITGKAPVIRRWPMIPGIDFAGVVVSSSHADFKAGRRGDPERLGRGRDALRRLCADGARQGRLAGRGSRPAFTAAETMAIGTAGYTAMLCVLALERHGVTPDERSGAGDGRGRRGRSVAIALLAKLGYQVTASTGRIGRGRLSQGARRRRGDRSGGAGGQAAAAQPRALGRRGRLRWASTTLANVLGMIKYGGAVAACGLAGGMDLPASVAPFILRGVTLAGVDSVMAPKAARVEAWARLERDLDRTKLADMTVTRPAADVVALAPEILAGKVRGRIVLELG